MLELNTGFVYARQGLIQLSTPAPETIMLKPEQEHHDGSAEKRVCVWAFVGGTGRKEEASGKQLLDLGDKHSLNSLRKQESSCFHL